MNNKQALASDKASGYLQSSSPSLVLRKPHYFSKKEMIPILSAANIAKHMDKDFAFRTKICVFRPADQYNCNNIAFIQRSRMAFPYKGYIKMLSLVRTQPTKRRVTFHCHIPHTTTAEMANVTNAISRMRRPYGKAGMSSKS